MDTYKLVSTRGRLSERRYSNPGCKAWQIALSSSFTCTSISSAAKQCSVQRSYASPKAVSTPSKQIEPSRAQILNRGFRSFYSQSLKTCRRHYQAQSRLALRILFTVVGKPTIAVKKTQRSCRRLISSPQAVKKIGGCFSISPKTVDTNPNNSRVAAGEKAV